MWEGGREIERRDADGGQSNYMQVCVMCDLRTTWNIVLSDKSFIAL